MNSFVRVFYGSFHRLAWSVAVGWLIFACVHGYGGPVNRFLSWKVFTPLSRLTYVVYLVHLNYLYMWSSTLRKPIYYTDLDHVQFYLGVIFGLNLLSFGISVMVEAPFLNLEKLIFSSLISRNKIINRLTFNFLIDSFLKFYLKKNRKRKMMKCLNVATSKKIKRHFRLCNKKSIAFTSFPSLSLCV